MIEQGTLSVVVIGRNEGVRLLHCLESVRTMHGTAAPVELIYVDSGSIDSSVAVAEAAGAQVVALQTDRPTAAKGRNAGWRRAAGDFVLFLDGDTVLHPGFVERGLREFQEPSVAVVWGHRRETDPGGSVYNRVLDLDWIYAPGLTSFCGGDALFRRSVLEQSGGFDERLIAGEEPELCRRILGEGHKILHIDAPMTGHDLAVKRFAQYWRRAGRAGHAYAEVAERFRTSDQPFWTDEVQRNRKRALTLMAVPAGGVVLSLLLRSFWPVLLAVIFLLLISVRSAWRARWKSKSVLTLLLYGMHSHFQQIPIYFGQRSFQRNHARGDQSALMEYK